MFKFLFVICVILVLVAAQDKRLIKFSEKDQGMLLTPEEVEKLTVIKYKGEEVHFFDITDTPDLEKGSVPSVSAINPNLRRQSQVESTCEKISESGLNNTIIKLSSYFTRFYTTETAVQSAHWLRDQYQGIISRISDSARRARFSVELFTHTWKQPSIIVRFKGVSRSVGDEIVVLGGHIDSTAGGADRRSPGADDDASGTATVLEAFRVLAMDNNFNPDRTVEFHGYAAEEVGLLGSQAVANAYKRDGKKVFAMLQNDMTGYNPASNQNKVGIITDFVDVNLTAILRKLVTEYGKLPWADTKCGYACSDHASFTRAGYRSAFSFEVHQFSMLNRNIHTANDLISHLDMKRNAQFVKTAVGFATELGYE